jgi:hypothetical protein
MPDIPRVERPSDQCGVCSSLAEHESAVQKIGRPDDDTYLPAASHDLIVVKEFELHGSRKLQLWRCPQCGIYYRYQTDYTFLVNGTEDEEYLARLTEEQAAEYLNRPAPA